MYYDFSAAFLKVQPPDTNFGEAWESLCYALLKAELSEPSLVRLAPPDKGVDILSRASSSAFQCKSSEQGAGGTLSANGSVSSLQTAMANRASLGWDSYAFCTNANYSGSAHTTINEEAKRLGLAEEKLDYKGPGHWDDLCRKHSSLVDDRFDFRVSASEKQLLDALKAGRYYDHYIQNFVDKMKQAQCVLAVKNNRTPVEIEIPFSPELTVKNCVHAVQALLGVTLDWTNFTDLKTSAGPSISLTIDRVAQSFDKRLADLDIKPGDRLEFWIKLVWRDETQKDAESEEGHYRAMRMATAYDTVCRWDVGQLTYDQRRRATLGRAETLVQNMIWTAARKLKGDA
jgi:hypothetical protein